ncbi:MAG: response regulator [Rhodomicrobium sp.]
MNATSAKPLQDVRVLVAEDDPLIALDVMGALLRAGANVLGPAMSVERALELAQAETIDCAVLDVMLRDGPVFPAAQILKNKGAGIVFYSGQAKPEDLQQHWPEAELLVKPVPLPELVRAVDAACHKRHR